MKPVDQTRLHDPPDSIGNCMAAAIASVLELTIDEVPDLSGGAPESWFFMLIGQLVFFCEVVLISYGPTETDLIPAGEHVVASGKSPRSDVGHSVVWLDGELAHDPHPSRDGIVGEPTDYWRLVPIAVIEAQEAEKANP